MENSFLQMFVVDDDESVRRSLSRLLRAAGFSSQSFSSAREFLEKVPPDSRGCIILDMRMPEMSGLELQDILIARKSPLSIIFISAIDSPEERDRAMKAGALGFLRKPFPESDLMGLIRSAAIYEE